MQGKSHETEGRGVTIVDEDKLDIFRWTFIKHKKIQDSQNTPSQWALLEWRRGFRTVVSYEANVLKK